MQPPPETDITSTARSEIKDDLGSPTSLFTPSFQPSHLEILRILDENPPDSISVIAIGPLTNIALAASHSPRTLMRAKSILVMGGAVNVPGNMTPTAEFNTYADATAAARVYALTSPNPSSTMPPPPPQLPHSPNLREAPAEPLPPYPPTNELGDRRLKVLLFPLDITTEHILRRDEFETKTAPLIAKGSPLAEWTDAFLSSTFSKMETLQHGQEGGNASLSLHDPLCVWYALTGEKDSSQWSIKEGEDLRVETAGQWTRGTYISDRRDRKRREDDDGEGDHAPNDTDGWLSSARGNRLGLCLQTPGERALAPLMLDMIFV